eukprot:CAMPEP_0204899100 /NCGR_PEP_ID=MMETSP1397-20131031/1662_1 /ASSEMBLY_ACC=CAM_ASM_000891 /TAXON_ID=49980 /ORGANISM="Climacostomum Climacostomum virens, Strain Stock W-24" /LENGTH=163 /DNA_ID=CAMNT_0052067017 /DNA_START=54 /DNA_END=545 /DNA_ORIENTATION=+
MAQAPQQQNAEPEANRNLMVNYIPTTIDELQLRQLFEQYGAIESIKIVCDRETRQSRGYGFVKFVSAASASHAIQELNGHAIMNKRLKVALAVAGLQQARGHRGGGNHGGNHGGPQFGGYNNQQGGYNQGANPYAQMQAQQQLMALQYQQYLAMQQAAQGRQQ